MRCVYTCLYMCVYILLHFLRILQVLVQEFGLKVDIEFIMSLTTLLEAFSVKASDVSTPIGLISIPDCIELLPSLIKLNIYNPLFYHLAM